MAADPLPSSELFIEALRNPGALDESELDYWDQEPPYTYQPNSVEGDQYTINLVDVMHGRRLRQAHQQEDARIAGVEAGDTKGVRDGMQADLKAAARNWKRVRDAVHCECDGMECDCRESRMARHWMQWQARAVYYLHGDLKALTMGTHVFIDNILARRNW